MTQLTQLSLSLQAAIQKFLPVASGNHGPVTSGTPQSPNSRPSSTPNRVTRPSRCIWCDSTEHFRRDCAELTAALNAGVTRYNDKGRLVNGASGEELLLMFE